MIPDFSVFCDSLAAGKYKTCFDGLGFQNLVHVDLQRPENVSALVDHLFAQSLIQSAKVCLRILAAYHTWLREQLE